MSSCFPQISMSVHSPYTTAHQMPPVPTLWVATPVPARMVSLAMAGTALVIFHSILHSAVSKPNPYGTYINAGTSLHIPDINECAKNTTVCDSRAICINTIGSFTCSCQVGYTGDGRSGCGKEYPNHSPPTSCKHMDLCSLHGWRPEAIQWFHCSGWCQRGEGGDVLQRLLWHHM